MTPAHLKSLCARPVCDDEKRMAMGGRRGARGGKGIARLRRWLLAGAVVLLTALVAIVSVARWKARKFLHDLPGKLGVDIKSQADGYTISRSVKGHTLYTVHAAKAIQRQNGKTTLHDVAITLYGPVGSNETDTIRGAEFEYDQPNGIVRAMGEVFLDLSAPSDASVPTTAKRIKASTSGLIFLQKLGVAATDEPIHLEYGDLRGGATGAEFQTDTGILRLRSNVQMDGTQDRQVVHLRAASAELDRNTRVATLHTGAVDAGGTRAAGDTVVMDAGPSGGIDQIRANGHAWVQTRDGIKTSAPSIVADLSAQNKPTLVTMIGGVTFASGDAGAFSGSSQNAVLHFNAAGLPSTADVSGDVRLLQASATSKDDLSADKVVATLIQDGAHRSILQQATATGSAVVRSVASGGLPKTTIVRGDTLHAVMGQAGRKQYVASLTGTGHTRLDEDDGAGSVRSSSGDTLDISLLPPGSSGTSNIRTAVQTGQVQVTERSPAAKGRTATETKAAARRAAFAGETKQLTLTGSPVVTGNGMQLAAEQVMLSQSTGDAEATGRVTGVYLPTDRPRSEPVHILADRGTVSNGGGKAKFFGVSKAARMWTSTAQVEAPVIELDRGTGRMMAHAAQPDVAASVHLSLPASGGADKGGPLRVVGSSLLYVPAEGTAKAHADVTGNVRMDAAGAMMTARQAVATMSGDAKAAGLMSGSVQQIVATGDVHLRQPGRQGQGDRLVYTASDETYVLSGNARVADSEKGAVAGATVTLHGNDNSVYISGGDGKQVHTETSTTPPKH